MVYAWDRDEDGNIIGIRPAEEGDVELSPLSQPGEEGAGTEDASVLAPVEQMGVPNHLAPNAVLNQTTPEAESFVEPYSSVTDFASAGVELAEKDGGPAREWRDRERPYYPVGLLQSWKLPYHSNPASCTPSPPQPSLPPPKLPVHGEQMTDHNLPSADINDAPSEPTERRNNNGTPKQKYNKGATSANIAATGLPHPHATRSAHDYIHVGPIYATRYAVLAREDRPYIWPLCGIGHKHPNDQKRHFEGYNGHGNCWARHGEPAGVKWDDHPSCKVGYADLNYGKVKEGYVVWDQESADSLEAALRAGREAKR